MTVPAVAGARDAEERERRSAAGMLFAHAIFLVVFGSLGGIVTSVAVGAAGAFDRSASGGLLGVVLLFEWGFVLCTVACAAFEFWLALQLERGETRGVRVGAIAMVVGSLALAPTGIVCSVCGISTFLLPLGWALASAVVVARVPDGRFREDG